MLTFPDLALWALVCLPALAGVTLLLTHTPVRAAAAAVPYTHLTLATLSAVHCRGVGAHAKL